MGLYDARGNDNIEPDPILTNISVEWGDLTETAGDVLFPTVRVNKQAGKYLVFGRNAWSQNFGGDVRAPGSRANEIPGFARWSEDTYFATEHALEMLVPDEERENVDSPFDPDRAAVQDVTSKIVTGREIAIRDLVHNAANYHANHTVTLAAGQMFNEYGTSNPIAVFRDAFREFHAQMSTVPNIAIMPYTVMSYLEDHPRIIERYVAQGGVVTAEQIAAILGINRIVVPGGAYNADGNPGRPDDISYIWRNHIVLAYVPPRAAMRTPAFGYEFVWPIRGQVQSADRRRDDDRVGQIHRVRRRYDLKLVAKDEATDKAIGGFLIRDAVDPALVP